MRQAMFRSLAEKHWTEYIYGEIALEHSHIRPNTMYFITNNDNRNPNRILVVQAHLMDNSFNFGWTRKESETKRVERESSI